MNPAPEPPIDCGPALLRRFRSDDLEELVELADDADVSANLRDTFPHPYTREDGLRWLGLTTGELRETNFVIEVDGRFAGGIGLQPLSDQSRVTAELGYWLGRTFWGRGLAGAVVGPFVDWAFGRFPGILRIQACVYEGNPASERVLERNGFLREGVLRRSIIKRGRVLDQSVWARLRD